MEEINKKTYWNFLLTYTISIKLKAFHFSKNGRTISDDLGSLRV